MAPWDMKAVLEKAASTGNRRVMVTERGFTFGYNNLVVDMRSFPVLRSFGFPVVFDVTHSVQRPGRPRRPLRRRRALHRHAGAGRRRGGGGRPLHGGPREPRAGALGRAQRLPAGAPAGPAPPPAAGRTARPAPRAADVGGASRAALLVFLLLAAVSASLALRAWLAPPKGTVFVGTFYYVDDFYNYLSYVEQAERGALVFRNKLAYPVAPAVARQPRVAGGRVALRAPRRARRSSPTASSASPRSPPSSLGDRPVARPLAASRRGRRLAGLLLVVDRRAASAALLLALGRLPGERALDVRTGAFPFVEAIANPHFVAGTALLLAALGAFAAGARRLGAALGTVLGLVRPYDAALLAGRRGRSPSSLTAPAAGVAAAAPARGGPRAGARLRRLALPGRPGLLGLLEPPLRRRWPRRRRPRDRPRPGRPARRSPPPGCGETTGAGHRLRLAPLGGARARSCVCCGRSRSRCSSSSAIGVPLLVLGAVGLARLPARRAGGRGAR